MATLVAAELRTAHLPPMSFSTDDLGGPSTGTPWVLRWLRPELRVSTPLGSVTRAPYGAPGETSWPLLALVLGGGVVLLVVLAVVGVVSLVRGR